MEIVPVCASEEVAGNDPLAIPPIPPVGQPVGDFAASSSGIPQINLNQHNAYLQPQYNQFNQAIAFVNADSGPQIEEIAELRHREVLKLEQQHIQERLGILESEAESHVSRLRSEEHRKQQDIVNELAAREQALRIEAANAVRQVEQKAKDDAFNREVALRNQESREDQIRHAAALETQKLRLAEAEADRAQKRLAENQQRELQNSSELREMMERINKLATDVEKGNKERDALKADNDRLREQISSGTGRRAPSPARHNISTPPGLTERLPNGANLTFPGPDGFSTPTLEPDLPSPPMPPPSASPPRGGDDVPVKEETKEKKDKKKRRRRRARRTRKRSARVEALATGPLLPLLTVLRNPAVHRNGSPPKILRN
jgi:hypothetical protein